MVTKAGASPFEGFQGPDLNQNVVTFSHVGWRNIHIVGVGADWLAELVVANHTGEEMTTEVAFEPLDGWARPVDPREGWLTLAPRGDIALERVRGLGAFADNLEDLGHGVYRVTDPATGIAGLTLRPGEELPFRIGFTPEAENRAGYAALRVVQYATDHGDRVPIGGQTYVFGEVGGWTADRESSAPASGL